MAWMGIVLGLLALVAAADAQTAKGEWPMPAHDAALTARSELPCKMPAAPKEV